MEGEKIYFIGHVYQITEPESGTFYIGSSVNLKTRMIKHKSDFYNDKQDNYYKPFYVELRRLNKTISDCTKITLMEYDNITIKQLRGYENDFIKKYKNDELNFNKNRTQITKKECLERMKNYYEENKNELIENMKKYFEENKEKINEWRKYKNICEICNGKYTNIHKSRHFQTKKHQKTILQQNK